MTRVTVWSEFRHEKKNPIVAKIYPDGMHNAIGNHLKKDKSLDVRTATLDEKDHGLPQSVIDATDVFVWWGHLAHQEVSDKTVEAVHAAASWPAPASSFCTADISRRSSSNSWAPRATLNGGKEENEREILWITRPGHPIVYGLDDYFILPREEMYGEFFDIPEPQSTFIVGGFSSGEVFRFSGCTWTHGAGKVVYFRPGHETFPTYHDKNVLKVIQNAVRWAAPSVDIAEDRVRQSQVRLVRQEVISFSPVCPASTRDLCCRSKTRIQNPRLQSPRVDAGAKRGAEIVSPSASEPYPSSRHAHHGPRT